MGLFERCQTVSDVAKLIGCDTCTLNETLDAYARSKDVGSCDLTGKTVFPTHISSASKDLLIARVTPSIHYTMGGISFNPASEVQQRLIDHFGETRHIRNLYAAGEVTGGVHGSNRLAGNSLLECCVFGRIAGERSATINQPNKYFFPESSSYNSESRQNWFPLVLREVKNTDEKYEKNTIEMRFNLYGARQRTGLDVGQFVGVRGEFNGETLQGYFSPITRPDDEGVIGILCRVDDKGGPITKLLNYIRPGSIIHMCPLGGLRLKFQEESILYRSEKIRRIGLLAGGTGIAPMIQIIRAYTGHIRKLNAEGKANLLPKHGLRLIHAAEGENDASFLKTLNKVKNDFPEHFQFYLKLDKPPIGWTEGVGYVEPSDIGTHLMYPSDENDLVVICGPPLFEHAMMKIMERLGFQSNQIFSFSEQDGVSAKR